MLKAIEEKASHECEGDSPFQLENHASGAGGGYAVFTLREFRDPLMHRGKYVKWIVRRESKDDVDYIASSG
jgi:hypothetical protein